MSRLHLRILGALVLLVVTALVGCLPSSSGGSCDDGEQNCACYTDGTCDPGLSCTDGTCIDPSAPANNGGQDAGGDATEFDCTRDADCAADERCNLETNQCGFACSVLEDCIAGEEFCNGDVTEGDGGVCVPFGGQAGCISSEDCSADQRCNLETSRCEFACTETSDCIEGEETCEDVGDGGGVCLLDDGQTNECTYDEDCGTGEVCDTATNTCVDDPNGCMTAAECDGEETCVESVCQAPESGYQFALISDITDTSNATLCYEASDFDPGSDILAVELLQNGASYWARWVNDDNIRRDGNYQDSPLGIIEGERPSWSGMCPDYYDGNAVSLGCGGSMIVEFVDDGGQVRPIASGDSIIVYEWGQQCQTDPEPEQDQWLVSICESSSDVFNAECAGEYPISPGSGVQEVYVSF